MDPKEYQAYLKQHLPKRIMVKLNKEFQFIAEQAKKRLVEIVQEESNETMREYLLIKGLSSGPPALDQVANAPETPATDDIGCEVPIAFDWGTFEGIDVFSEQATAFLTDPDTFSFPWSSESKQDQADSAYGSNIVDGGSTLESRGKVNIKS